MQVKTGLEIVRLHTEYRQKINELEDAIAHLEGHGYTQSVLEDKLVKIREELRTLEETRFQPLEPIVIGMSLLGGK